MRKFAYSCVFAVSALFVGATSFGEVATADAGESCYNCSQGSSADQCKQGSGGDTSARRKECEAAGCKISGTGSCSTAANVKVINP